ncbi:serine-rich adhesin for platelets isoform X2 [Lucilia sericata]|nr:serine-rich adhesin for platelets isoform X2 [Lucilia sericata]
MPQTKQYSQQQQIIQHTSHTNTATATTTNPQHHQHQHHLHQQPQHVQQINLAASSIQHHQTQHHHNQQQQQQQQQPTPTAHMIQVSEEFLEQAANNHNTGNMMISTTGEVINQQQIFKIVSTDGTTGNMIIDATNQNANTTTTTSKVLLSNLTVLSKQQTTAQGQIIASSHQQSPAAGQTINFVNAKNLYTTSATGGSIATGGKQQKFTVATANVGNYKGSTLKQTSSVAGTQYLQQTNAMGQQKINMTAGNRNMQMLTTTRVQSGNANSNTNSSNVALLTNNTATAQTMVLQQHPQKFITNNTVGTKTTTTALGSGGGNIIKKSTTTGTLRMNNSNNTTATTKLMNNLQTTQGVKTFITQTPSLQQQQTQNINQLTLQHHTTKGSGGKSKFVKQYNNAILNSAGAVTIATLPHQQSNSQNNLQIQQQQQLQHQQLQPQTTYINHHKNSGGGGSTKINKINSKYAQSVNVAAQLPPGTQLHQKSINQQTQQQQQQQFQTASSNSNIKFVNAQGTIIQQQQQPQKFNNKHHHQQQQQQQQQQYQNLQNYDIVDGNHLYSPTTASAAVGATSSTSTSTGTTSLTPATAASTSSLLTDDIMMVNGTQMTDELSARILQSMSQKSFSNQRYQQQQQQHVFQTKSSTTTPSAASSPSLSSNSNTNNNNMLPPPTSSAPQNTIMQTNNSNNNNSNILLSPREYTLYPTTAAAANIAVVPASHHQQQQQSSPNHYSNATNPTALAATASSNITAGSFSSNNYITVSNNSNSMTTITPHTTGGTSAVANSTLTNNSTSGSLSGSAVRQAQSAPNSRSQSMERKLHESSMSRKSTEYYKVNNHNSLRGSSSSHHSNLVTTPAAVAQSSGSLAMASASATNLMGGVGGVVSTAMPPSPMPRPPSIPPAALIMEPQAQVIHLQATKTLPGANNSSNDDDDDIIGEEIRPAPVETEDIRLRILHAVLLDHTYVNPMPLELPTSFAIQLAPASNSNASSSTSATSSSGVTGHSQQWSLGGIGAVAATAAAGGVAQQNYALYSTQLTRLQQDEDSYSAISTSSRLAVGDIDPGEETETAPEAELEDDSITRCICDLTHDDGYMICCDKCCAWQHVDCMGIDRQNIPDEYLCELCQPRDVDKVRARSLQLLKRKEQQQQLMLTAQAQAVTSAGTMGAAGSASGGSGAGGVANLLPNDVLGPQQRLAGSTAAGFNLTGNTATDNAALQLFTAGGTNLKKGAKMLKKVKDGVTGKRSKKAEKLAAAAAAGLTPTGKPARKETKKNTKRKKAGAHDGSGSTVGMTAAEKHAANLRQWIENYELAVTNHYSPELRARLHAITKQPSLLQSILNTENPILKEFSNGSLENRATTVPHAGGKILISNLDISPNSPICELRGKYMLTTQYKTQNTSMNMNSPPPNNYHLASYKAHKTPGPFIFFYQLPGTEVTSTQHLVPQTTTTTTLNADGTYTTTTTTLPAQQSPPPTFLKGPEICVDTRTYGNEARFVRRSCRPNAEIQHLFEKGTIHLFIVALTDIRASTEITIRHEPHDLLAVDNKKSSTMIIQPTSTPCACGLTKDCIFGPPLPQLPPAAKSNAGRKSLAHGGAGTANTGNLTAKQRKANQQNLNRNRSISSSASGDSNMGTTATTTTNTVAMGLNSPNNVGKTAATNKMVNCNTLMPLTASCNSNLSNASSTSSTLTSIMHDSGVCTSSSSPSVSIPSPTQHMHSPIQQQQQQQVQQQQQQLLHNPQMRSTTTSVQLLPQQQQQQLMQSLPTPLMVTTPPDMQQPHHPHLHQQQQQHQQTPLVLQQPAMIIQQQPLSVIAQATTSHNTGHDALTATEQTPQAQAALCLPAQPATVQPAPQPQAQTQPHHMQQQLLLQEHNQVQMQAPASQHTTTMVAAASTGLLETVSPEATIAAVALQSLNASHSPNVAVAAPSPVLCANVEPTQLQHQQFVIVPAADTIAEPQQTLQQNQSCENLMPNTSAASPSLTSSPQQQQQQQPQHHQTKSPQKNNHSQHNSTHPGRKTPGKQGRTTSVSEDNEHHNEDNSVTSTPTSASTPKEKPKLSREDRKMEAILRAIEKMERNQQRKQEQKQTKRQNAGSSHNTTPTSPNKSFDSVENSGGTKRTNNHTGTGGRSKKKRKAGKGGQGGAHNNQRKRRQSRKDSQESVDESSAHDHEAVTSESDGCTAMHSPPIQTMASQRQQPQCSSLPTTSSAAASSAVASTRPPPSNEAIANNVDQAAGLLMAFANPTISPSLNSSSASIPTAVEQNVPQSPIRSTQYAEAAASSPPTPPSHVSSACLLIEAAVGPLETNLDGQHAEMHNSEFKYPLQAKTKKHLMNNWLHQAEENMPADNNGTLTEPTPQLPQAPMTSVTCSGLPSVSASGLDSLLQAAMSDLKQSQDETEQPQNLSIAAQKVEEFIQQTEASAGSVSTPTTVKHSYEYDQQRQYANMPIPAVDLTLKTPLTIGPMPNPPPTSEVSTTNRNFHLPLQVSTCSNNSSVKKRWLRQAISEETHEEFQNSFSMTPSPTIAVVNNNFVQNQTQQQPQQPATASTSASSVTNGFTTPLKKRRLLLTGKDETEENLSQSCGDLSANATPSPPPAPVPAQQLQLPNQMQFSPLKEAQPVLEEYEHKDGTQDLPSQDMQEDVDVDVEKCEMNEAQIQQPPHEHPLHHEPQYPKIEMDQEQDVDVTTSPPQEDGPLLEEQIKMETVIKHEDDLMLQTEVKEESTVATVQQTDQQTGPAEFNDQEDDVDILRSPSPGREMIKAEDNLVKIEPEDTSGTEDVKIDVEREESMAADDDVVTQHNERKEIVTTQVFKEEERVNTPTPLITESIEIKQEVKMEIAKEEPIAQEEELPNTNREMEIAETKADIQTHLEIKTEEESQAQVEEPKPKRLKLERTEVEEQKPVTVKKEQTKPETLVSEEVNVKQEMKTKTEIHSKVGQKQELVVPHSTTNNKEIEKVENVLKLETTKMEKQVLVGGDDTAEVTSSSSSTLLAVRTVAADTTFADVDASTPPPPPTTTVVGGTAAPIQRHKSLSDDDIQARLHNFHKENILILQSRNKKTKSSSSSAATNSNSNSTSNNCLTTNSEHHKNRTTSSSSSSSNNQQHHNHHHHHHHHQEGKEKSDKSSSKHHKSSSTTSSGSSKKQKLHKRERTTSSSSSNSHKNSSSSCSTPQISSSSSSLLSKNAVINSTINSTGSSKKLKSLKKSSSGSSTSSSTSSSSYASSNTALQNCYPTPSSTTPSADKEKQQRQRTTSSSSSSNNNNIGSSSNVHATPTTTPYPSSKKRQLNFELELTKDMHLLNSNVSASSKHKREASKLAADEQGHVVAKKSRKDTVSTQKDELKNGTNKQLVKNEKQIDKKFSTTTAASNALKTTAATVTTSGQVLNATAIPPVTATTPTPLEEPPKHIPTIVSQPPQTPIPVLREHPTLPHFNNVVIATNSTLTSHQQPPLPPVQHQPPPPVLPQNIPNHVNSPSYIPTVQSNQHNQQLQHPPLPPTPPSAGGISSPLSTTPSVNATNHLPFYNTIYGKLLDNPTPPPSLPTPMTPTISLAATGTTPPPITANTSAPTAGGVLSEYLDTKLKSYSTLGGYVSHTALFGLNNAANIKDSSPSAAVVSSTTIASASVAALTNAVPLKETSTEMPAPLPPPPVSGGTITLTPSCSTSGNIAATSTPLKIHTKTASHDPRLNPQLTAPEPPPQPKRKLSINEYRKRMQQSSSNDSNSGGSSLTTTPTTPPTPLETTLLSSSSTLLAPTAVPPVTNKCTLNSPDRLTQSVDSQIQKEIMSSNTAVTSSSSLDSLNSSNSSTSSNSLNDTLLKSSSFVEEDSTKGQFNAAPTLLEKQQESLCARLKSLKEKQSLGTAFSVGSGNRSRFSSFSESVASSDFGLRKDDDDMDIIRNRNLSISSSIGGGDLLDNCLEEISSTSTSMSSSREPSPERCYTTTTTHHKILTASATTTMTNANVTSHSNNGQNARHHQQQQQQQHQHHQTHTTHHYQQQQQHINCDKNEMTGLERKRSVDIA